MADCIFCQIVQHKMQAKVVYEDNEIIAFRDISPQAPVHILIVPKKHIPSVNDLSEVDDVLIGRIHRVSKKIAKDESCVETGFRLVLNTGPDAGQAVEHLHFHLFGGRKFSWPPG